MTPFEFDYRSIRPDGELGRLVELIWFARGVVPYQRERIGPTGSTVGIIILGDPIIQTSDDGRGAQVESAIGLLVGPHDRPIVNEPTGETHALGVVTTPIGCEAVFGVTPSRIRGLVVPLEEVWPEAGAIRSRLEHQDDPDDMLALLEAALRTRAREIDQRVERCEAAVALLEADPTRPIVDIARDLDVSHGYLDREFTRVVGLTPRSLASLLRVRRMLAALDVHADNDWSELALAFGWFDQAHLIRDFKRHTGVTPTRYISAQRAVLNGSAEADTVGFVPEL